MNEETIIEKRPNATEQSETKKGSASWKHVTISGVSGILLGAGLVYAGETHAAENEPQQEPEKEEEPPIVQDEAESLKVADSHDELSFGEAFAAARAEVGPGGVFHWHGGVYGTYYADEWNAMTAEQKNDFAQQALPEVRTAEANHPVDSHPDVAVHTEVDPSPQPVNNADDVQMVDPQVAQSYQAIETEDVHIVGYANVNGHLAVGYDVDGDDFADVAIIDIGVGGLSGDDLVVGPNGQYTTIEEIAGVPEPDPNQMTTLENPDVAPGMPDYMNDANVDGMDIIA